MTPLFAAPEQVAGGTITTATDEYALGALLYLLLTGLHPAGPGPYTAADLVKTIVDVVPPNASDSISSDSIQIAGSRSSTPEKLRKHLRGDLDTMLAKSLRKEPAKRYGSVAAFAEDLRRYLKNEPISARPETALYRMAKFVRRNRVAASLAAGVVLTVLAGIAGILMQVRATRAQRDFALKQLARADEVNSLNQFLLMDASPSKPLTVNELLKREAQIIEKENYTDDPANHIQLLSSLGGQFFDKSENDESMRLLQEAYNLSRGSNDHSARARAACTLAWPLMRGGQHAKAESMIQEGLGELPSETEYLPDRVFCLERASEVAQFGGDAVGGIARALDALRRFEESPVRSKTTKLGILVNLETGYMYAGRFREAIATDGQAASLLTELGYQDTATAASLYSSWALTMMYAGRPLDAEKEYREALEILDPQHSSAAISNLCSLGRYPRRGA